MVDLVAASMRTVHLVFAAAWVGSVLFVTFGILPVARDRSVTMNAKPIERIVVRLTNVSRLSALALLLTGGHMAMTGYGVAGLTGTTAGYLVILMVVLWLALAAIIEVAAARMTDQLREKHVMKPANDFQSWFYAASAIAVCLLLDAGAIFALGT